MPRIWVAPVRSHSSPTTISPFCCAVAVPARPSAPAAAIALVTSVIQFFIAFLPDEASALVRKWPYPEIITDVAPQPVQTFRLHDQEENDQTAEHDQTQVRDRVQQIALRKEQPAEILEKPAGEDRQQGDEDGAEDRAEDRPEPADDDHRQVIDRHGQLELFVIRDAEVIGVKHPRHAGVKRRDRKRPQLVAEDVDADDLGGDLLVADRDEATSG